MTEAEWNASTDPAAMLYVVQGPEPEYGGFPTRKISERKMKLFVEACRQMRNEEVGESKQHPYAAEITMSIVQEWTTPRWENPSLAVRAALLREIVGNPFRPVKLREEVPSRWPNTSYVFEPSWLTWKNGTVPRIAQAIYDERRWEDMPILADAIEDAGSDCEDLLTHCRSGGIHVRGCWAVDLILGKE